MGIRHAERLTNQCVEHCKRKGANSREMLQPAGIRRRHKRFMARRACPGQACACVQIASERNATANGRRADFRHQVSGGIAAGGSVTGHHTVRGGIEIRKISFDG